MVNNKNRLEKGIKNQPDRYIVKRSRKKELIEVHDKNSGFLWKKIKHNDKEGWIWVS